MSLVIPVTGAIAALLAGIPYSWSAIVTFLNAKHAKHTGTPSLNLISLWQWCL